MFGITAVGVATTGYFMSLGSIGLFVLSAIALRLALTDYKLPVLIILIAALIAFVAFLLSIGALVFGQISALNLPRIHFGACFICRDFCAGLFGRAGA